MHSQGSLVGGVSLTSMGGSNMSMCLKKALHSHTRDLTSSIALLRNGWVCTGRLHTLLLALLHLPGWDQLCLCHPNWCMTSRNTQRTVALLAFNRSKA